MTKGSSEGKFYTGIYAGLDERDIVHLLVPSTCAICGEMKNLYVLIPVIQNQVCQGCHKNWPRWVIEANQMFITKEGGK